MSGCHRFAHGSALDIAGRDRANPLACIRAAALLLRHSLGRNGLGAQTGIDLDAFVDCGAWISAALNREFGSGVARALPPKRSASVAA